MLLLSKICKLIFKWKILGIFWSFCYENPKEKDTRGKERKLGEHFYNKATLNSMESNNASFSLITHFNVNQYKFYVKAMTAERGIHERGAPLLTSRKCFLSTSSLLKVEHISKQGREGSCFPGSRKCSLLGCCLESSRGKVR